MQVIVAVPLSGPRARLADALRDIALPGVAVVGVEPRGAGTGTVGVAAFFEWGVVLLDTASWGELQAAGRQVGDVMAGGGLQVLPPCLVRVVEPGAASEDLPADVTGRTAVLEPEHLRDALIELARQRYGMQQWSTADALWTLDLLRLPQETIAPITETSLAALGFLPSRVPTLDGHSAVAAESAPVDEQTASVAPVQVPAVIAEPAHDAEPAYENEPVYDVEPAHDAEFEEFDHEHRGGFPVWAAVAALAAVVVAACVIAFSQIGGGNADPDANGSGATVAADSTAVPQSNSSPTPSIAALPVPAGFTSRGADIQTNCAAHAYGQVAEFFGATPCTRVQRQLLTNSVAGHPVVFAVRDVVMPNAAQATSLKTLVDSSGTGNVSDLLREGVTFPGGPASLPASNVYASAANGTRVRVVEAGSTDGTSAADVAGLQAAADALAGAF